MFFWSVAIGILVFDWVTKYLVITTMEKGQSIPVIKNIFHITFVQNPGAAFGIFAYQTWFFIAVAVVVTGIIIYFNYTLPQEKKLLRFGLALQLGGASGNLVDRVRTGYVVDMFDFIIWPVFNIADIAIVLGVIILAIELFREEREERTLKLKEK